MTTQTVNGMTVMPAPSVNLMPPEIAEAQRFRRFQLAMGGLVVGAVAIVGLLYVNAHHKVSAAQNQVSAAQAQAASVQQQVNGLQFVASAYQQVADAKSLLAEAMAGEVRWSFYLEDLSLRVPDNVWLTNMAITQGAGSDSSTAAPTSATGAATPAVIAPPDQIATITFTGVALSHDDVAKWLTAIAGEKGWSDPYVTAITEAKIGATTVYNWQGTAYVTSKALSGRYAQSGS